MGFPRYEPWIKYHGQVYLHRDHIKDWLESILKTERIETRYDTVELLEALVSGVERFDKPVSGTTTQ